MSKLQLPFQAIDHAIAERVAAWHNTDDALFKQSISATSLALQQGHSCLSIDACLHELPYERMEEVSGIPFPNADNWLDHLSQFDLSPSGTSPFILDNRRLYFRRYWQFENELASYLSDRLSETRLLSKPQHSLAKKLLADYFPTKNDDVDKQKLAAMNCLLGSTNIIIGGPGTGKTYTVTRILALLASLAEQPPLIKLAAPTGKAAQRLAEAIREAKASMNLDLLLQQAIPDQASTLHRLLGVIPNQLQFRHQRGNPIEADILLVDEVSMVDLPLMVRLVRAIKPTTQLILLGDGHQLPSVAAGSVLADLVQAPHTGYSAQRLSQLRKLDSKLELHASPQPADFATELTVSRRFKQHAGIGRLAKAVIQGNVHQSLTLFGEFDDIQWKTSTEFENNIQHWIRNYYWPLTKQADLASAFTQLKSFRILCALRDGETGVDMLNDRIQRQLNVARQPFYQGQPIMITQNHYGLKLFNGDVGLIWPNGEDQLMAWFEADEGYRPVALGRLPATETVYAMTIHKTQGSEFQHVVMVLPDHPNQLVTRELIYTGLTRAKESFTYIGEQSSWQKGVEAKVERWAGLAEKLHQ